VTAGEVSSAEVWSGDDVTTASPKRQAGPCAAWPADSAFIREVLDRVGDKWSILVISTLRPGALRYSDLHASIPGISQRILTATLKGLARDGLITRTAFAEAPPRVEYELTPLGSSLSDAVLRLAAWAAEHHLEVAINRERHDVENVKPVRPTPWIT
jgi:DNA-binding HxlR family transcriptional regulator